MSGVLVASMLCVLIRPAWQSVKVLPFYFQIGDDPDTIARRHPQKSAPRFCCFEGQDADQFFVFVDNQVLTQANSFSTALLTWFGSHYLLNLEYSQKIKEVALFFQEFVCALPATNSESKKNATYLSVTSDIQKYVL